MPLGQNSPLVDHYDTASQLSRRTTPSSDADKSGVAPRKRVPVAVSPSTGAREVILLTSDSVNDAERERSNAVVIRAEDVATATKLESAIVNS